MSEVSIADFTELIREADRLFETVGGSTRHYVADCLLPLMEEKGMKLINAASPAPVGEAPQAEERELHTPVDFTNPTQMAEDAWLFLTNDELPNKYKVGKKAFLHEVGCMLELMKGHYETEIERLKGEREAPKWISVNDRLPEEGGRYWCYVRELTDLGYSHFQWNCAYNAKEKRFSDSTITNGENVTHWMKLPEPPKPQTENE